MEWKDIPGFEGLYQVSSCGKIKSLKRICKCQNGFRTVPEKILYPNLDAYGYERALLSGPLGKKTHKVHRLVALAFIGKSDLCINHKDLNRRNNHYSNLEYTTLAENTLHARALRPWAIVKGKDHYRYKITPEMEKEIRKLRATKKLTHKELAALFNVSQRNIGLVLTRRGRFCRPTEEEPLQSDQRKVRGHYQ